MSNDNSKLNTEIDAGSFFLGIFKFFFLIGLIGGSIWFYKNVYKPDEKAYQKGARYAYSIIYKEMVEVYKEKNYIFDARDKNDDYFCKLLIKKYAQNGVGTCTGFNPLIASENFRFKNKKITVLGLEKPMFEMGGASVKDILIDVNGEDKGENQVGSDRIILRLYSSGNAAPMITPVNCSINDEKEYGLKRSIYCMGSPEANYLMTNKPLAFDIEQIGGEDGKTRAIGKNLSFLRADCSAMDGSILQAEDYCSDKMLYMLKGCDDEYVCNITLTKY